MSTSAPETAMSDATPEQWDVVLQNQGLVWFHLNNMRRLTDEERDEAFADGCIGLLRAAQKFDPDKGFAFSTYAMWWIRQQVDQGIKRRLDSGPRSEWNNNVPADDRVLITSIDREVDSDEDSWSVSDHLASTDPAPERLVLAVIELQRAEQTMRDHCRDTIDEHAVDAIMGRLSNQDVVALLGVHLETVRRRIRRLLGIVRALELVDHADGVADR